MFNTIVDLFAVASGSVLAIFYFGGLWWTVRRLATTSHPAAIYFGSLLVRLALVMTIFFIVIAYTGWISLIALLVGFLSTRLVLFRILGREPVPVFAERVS